MKNALFTLDELKQMQAWSLEQKVRETQRLILEWYNALDGMVYVSFSAGKDNEKKSIMERKGHGAHKTGLT